MFIETNQYFENDNSELFYHLSYNSESHEFFKNKQLDVLPINR